MNFVCFDECLLINTIWIILWRDCGCGGFLFVERKQNVIKFYLCIQIRLFGIRYKCLILPRLLQKRPDQPSLHLHWWFGMQIPCWHGFLHFDVVFWRLSISQWSPPKPWGQRHLFGLIHFPSFMHGIMHFAKIKIINIMKLILNEYAYQLYFEFSIQISQCLPKYPLVHWHLSFWMHLPPFKHFCSHIPKKYKFSFYD